MTIPRPEYPRPQFVRVDASGEPDWLCLNGAWQFEIDAGDSGKERGLLDRDFERTITVPFCPESVLSGVEHTDYMPAVWYRRRVEIPLRWQRRSIILHFQAVDYDATVWIDGTEAGRHRGGFTPFSIDITAYARPGETVDVVLRARDQARISQPRGKQANQYAPHSCFYTRTTGIWQTVWMEAVHPQHLRRPRITPDTANGMFRVELPLSRNVPGSSVRATLTDAQGTVAAASCRCDADMAPMLDLAIPEDRRHLWHPGTPHLYGMELELFDRHGDRIDRAFSYAGLRSITIDGVRLCINGEPLFQRLVLDQGYYPDGVMTAPSDGALINDIEISMAAGFNGARLHQKVFEERFLYHADRLGYLIWGEFADWGCSGFGPVHDHQQPGITYVAQWLEAMERDYSHPAIIGWCPLNETAQPLHDRITVLDDATRALFLATKAADRTRPVLDTSGYSHRVPATDVYDSHDYIYEKDFSVGIANFRERHDAIRLGTPFVNPLPPASAASTGVPTPVWSIPWRGQPYFVSEFGGFKWNPNAEIKSAEENVRDRKTSWGYGSDPVSEEDFYGRFAAVCEALLDNPMMFGYCYTQLTDVYPEENGLYAFDRKPKFDIARVRAIQQRPAAYEAPSPPEEQP